MDENERYLLKELSLNGMTQAESKILVSLLSCLGNEFVQRIGISNICAHMASWYAEALRIFKFDDEDKLLHLYKVQHYCLVKASVSGVVSYSSSADNDSIFSRLFEIAPKIEHHSQKRHFGRFVFFHVLRHFTLHEPYQSSKLDELTQKFSSRFLKKEKISIAFDNIINANISDDVFLNLTKELVDFITHYSFVLVGHFYYENIPMTSVVTSTAPVNKVPTHQLPNTHTSDDLSDDGMSSSSSTGQNNRFISTQYPIAQQDTDYLSYRRHNDQAMCLPWQAYSLSNSEKKRIVIEVMSDLNCMYKEALFFMLMILTAKGKDDILSIPIIWSCTASQAGIYPQLNLLLIPHLHLRGRFKGSNNHYLMSHDDLMYLPLPTEICNVIAHLDPKRQAHFIYQLYKDDSFDFTYRNQIKHRAHVKRRLLSTKAFQYLLFDQIQQQSDQVCASLILATDKFSNPLSLYYYSITTSFAVSEYQSALRNIGLSLSINVTIPDGTIGSELAVNRERFKERISELVSQIKGGINSPNSVTQFNNIALYTSLVLMLNGFSRRSNHLFFSENTISLKHNLMLMCDKYTEAYSAVRLLPLTNVAKHQIQTYKNTLKYFGIHLSECDPKNSELLYSHYKTHYSSDIPTVIMIEGDKLRPIRTKDVMQWLEMDLPENFARHLMVSSSLKNAAHYRQILLGHYNQGQHANDPFRLGNEIMFGQCQEQFEFEMRDLGIVELVLPSIRGGLKKTSSMSRYSTQYYPARWLEREEKNKKIVRRLKALIPISLLHATDYKEINNGFLALQATLSELPEKENNVANKYLSNWQSFFKQTTSKRLRERHLNKNTKSSTPLLIFEYDRQLHELREHYLNFISKRQISSKDQGFIVFLSICLFQPDFAKRLYKGKPLLLELNIINQCLLGTFTDSNKVEQTYPLNALSTGLLIKYQLSMKEVTFKWSEMKVMMKEYIEYLQRHNESKYSMKHISTFNRFVFFCIRYSIMTSSALTKTDGDNYSLPSTHYPLKELSRLMLPYSNINRQWQPVSERMKKVTFVATNNTYDYQTERGLYHHLHHFFKDNISSGAELSQNFRKQWAKSLNIEQDDIISLLHGSSNLSQYMQCLLWFMNDHCSRLSKHQKPFASNTIYSYISTLDSAINRFCTVQKKRHQSGVIQFAQMDDETHINIYREALNDTVKRDKRNLAINIKTFHQRVSKAFNFDDIDWEAYFPELSEYIHPKGIARIFTPYEHQLAYDYLSNYKHFSEYERAVHLVCLTLGYRCGMRKQEVKNLKHYDIDINSWVIEISSSESVGTKSINAPRRISVRNFLNETEKEALKYVICAANVHQNIQSSQFLFDHVSVEFFIDIEQVFRNVTTVIRASSGNPDIRFYDLRHNVVNFHLMLFSEMKYDHRFQPLLLDWTRSQDIESFSHTIITELLGVAPNHGATLMLAFAKYMGHSLLTQRDYYHHCLALIGEVEANLLVDKHLSNKNRKNLHILDSPKLAKHYVKQVQSEMKKRQSKHATYPYNIEHLNMAISAGNAKTQQLNHLCVVLYNLIFYIQDVETCSTRHSVRKKSLINALTNATDFVIQTNHKAISLGWYSQNTLNIKPKLVKKYSRYMNADSFKHLLKSLIILSVEEEKQFNELSTLWKNRAFEASFIIMPEELNIITAVAPKLQLIVDTKQARLRSFHVISAIMVKFKHKGAKKYCMEKFSLAMLLITSTKPYS